MNKLTVYETPIFVRGAAENGYLAHRAVYSVMGEPKVDLDRDFIFDLESVSRPEGAFALVRSTRLPRRGAGSEIEVPRSGTYAFQLRAVPRRSSSGKRASVDTDPDRLFWLTRQAAAHGFDLCGSVPKITSRPRHFTKPGLHLTVLETNFTGHLVITDPQKFVQAWLHGIGRYRGFGYGMLNLSSPAITN